MFKRTGSSGQRRLRRRCGAVPRSSSGEGSLTGVAIFSRPLTPRSDALPGAEAAERKVPHDHEKKDDPIRDRPA